jgi:hypothetical protein
MNFHILWVPELSLCLNYSNCLWIRPCYNISTRSAQKTAFICFCAIIKIVVCWRTPLLFYSIAAVELLCSYQCNIGKPWTSVNRIGTGYPPQNDYVRWTDSNMGVSGGDIF